MKRDAIRNKDPERDLYDNSIDYIEAKIRRRKRKILALILAILLLLAGLVWYLAVHYHIHTVYVEGNTRYSNEEISSAVMNGPLDSNSLILTLKYKIRPMPEFPFVEKMTLEIVSRDTVKITVYEKAIAGYVEYLGSYVYFDRNGTVVETSAIPLEGIPLVTGLKFEHIVLYQPLPIDDQDIFARILNVTQMLTKYELNADKIYFDSQKNMSVYFADVRADLGQDEYMDEKISNLSRIIPELEGKNGVLSMENFNSESNMVIFQGK